MINTDTFYLRDLHDLLVEDQWRKTNAFSEEMRVIQEYLLNPYSTLEHRKNALAYWFQRYQPCLFGSVAAASDSIHYCLIGEEDLQRKTDSEIAAQIKDDVLEWKRRALRPNLSAVSHSFVLLVYSSRLAHACPDNRLSAFAKKVRELWGCPHTVEAQGVVHWEQLFLSNPEDTEFRKFDVPVDFFAAQGDGRWWHDHRAPGGILFTANSVGHMRCYREWYREMPGQQDWTLATAMQTIARAAITSHGQATWLHEIGSNDEPIVAGVECPFANRGGLKPEIQGKDWTKYLGYLHTDHSIRSEFFRPEPELNEDIRSREFLEDFTYLYDASSPDHQKLISGIAIDETDIDTAIGSLAAWHRRHRAVNRVAAMKKLLGFAAAPFHRKSAEQLSAESRLEELLTEMQQWCLSPGEINAVDQL